MALGLMMLLEGLGPMVMPEKWQRLMAMLASQPPALIQRYGGILVVAGAMLLLFLL